MTKENIIETVKAELIKKGIPESLIIIKSERIDWKEKIRDLYKYSINEIEQFSLFVIDSYGNLCECYIFVDDYDGEKPYKLTKIINEILIEVFEVCLYSDEDEIEYIIKYISERKLTLGLYLTMIELMSEMQNSNFFYRGHSSKEFCLVPGLYRLSTDKKYRYVDSERKIFKEAIRNSPNEYPESMSSFEKLVKMQHYGLPTRLLDITQSSLVALYFAVNSLIRKDGEVIIFKINKKEWKEYDDPEVKKMTMYLDGKSELKDDVIPVKPLLNNPRIKAQGGRFLLFGEDEEKESSQTKFYFRRIIIPKLLKKSLEKELKRVLIDESTMYQDLEHTMKNVKNQFLNL